MRQQLKALLVLADRFGCAVDLHIDEADRDPGAGLQQLLRVQEQLHCRQPITCSHASSLALLPQRQLRRLAERMADARLQVVALPLTNGWLLGRVPDATPVQRPLAPIQSLAARWRAGGGGRRQRRGSLVPGWRLRSSGSDGGLAAPGPAGPLAAARSSPVHDGRGGDNATRWNGVLREGAPADLVVLQAGGWSDALRRPPQRQVLIAGRWWQPAKR